MKQYAIYGINRVEKDFRYMFQDIEVAAYFDDNYKEETYRNVPVLAIETWREHRQLFEKLIICDFTKDDKTEKLEKLGLQYETDYVFEEDFFEELDDFKAEDLPSDRKVVLWGTGRVARRFLEECPEIEADFFIDSDKSRRMFSGKKVCHPDEIEEWGDCFIIVAIREGAEVIACLQGKGLKMGGDFISYTEIYYAPSKMLRKTIFDRSYYPLTCDTMKNHFEVDDMGNCAYCCAAFQSINAGNVLQSHFVDIWNSSLHKALCLSAENHTYTFCDKMVCPLFFSQEKEVIPDKLQQKKCRERQGASDSFLQKEYQEMEPHPQALLAAIDKSCNLSCITCREHLHVAKGEEKSRSLRLAEIIIQDILPGTSFLIIAGNGEVFLSEAYKKIYLSEACSKIGHVRLLSNGLLLTEKNWQEFYENNQRNEIILTVSIDAARKETYEKIRQNGKFAVIQQNMDFAAKLRREGKLSYLRMNFVVQKENYQEMPKFVAWAKRVGADETFFTKIRNWGTYTDEEFKEISMMEEDSVTPKAQLIETLKNPIMKDEIVELGTINYRLYEEHCQYVDNYYEWELMKRSKGLF